MEASSKEQVEERGRRVGIGCAVVALLLGIVVTAFRPAVRWFYLHNKPPDVQLAAQKFMTEPQNFPANWATRPRISKETTSATSELTTKWQSIEPSMLTPLGELGDAKGLPLNESLTTHAKVAAIARSAVGVTSDTVHRPDFSLDGQTNWFAFQQLARAAYSIAIVDSRDGKMADALDAAMVPLYMSQRQEASNLLTHLVAVAIQSLGGRALVIAAANCTDAGLLQQKLEELARLRPKIVLNIMPRAELLDVVNELQGYKARGLSVDLSPGKPLVYYYKQVWKYKRRVLEEDLAKETPGSPMAEQIQHELMFYSWEWVWGRRLVPEVAYLMDVPNLDEAMTRESVATARIDLARLFIAQRIEALSGGGDRSATSPQQIVKKYFDQEPKDPFGGGGYKFDKTTQSFYSVGPDKADDGNLVEYDPTNGTLSQGDVAVRAVPTVSAGR